MKVHTSMIKLYSYRFGIYLDELRGILKFQVYNSFDFFEISIYIYENHCRIYGAI